MRQPDRYTNSTYKVRGISPTWYLNDGRIQYVVGLPNVKEAIQIVQPCEASFQGKVLQTKDRPCQGTTLITVAAVCLVMSADFCNCDESGTLTRNNTSMLTSRMLQALPRPGAAPDSVM